MAEPTARPMGNRDVLRLPEFRKLFAAQAISDVGDGMTFMALLLLVNNLTHSPAALAVLSIAVAVPSMVGGVIAGAYADRLDRRRIMIVSDAVRAALVLVFVIAGTVERLPILYVVAFLQAAVGTLFSPSRGALIPKVVSREGLMAANGLGQLSRMIGGLVGTGLTGVIFALSGAAWPVFVLDAATFVASVLIVLRVDPALGRVPEHPAGAARQGVRASAVEGLRIIGRSPTLVATVAGLAIAMLGLGAVNVLFVPFLIDVLHESAAWAGPLEAAQTISMVLASGLVAGLATRASHQSIVIGSLVGVGAMIAPALGRPWRAGRPRDHVRRRLVRDAAPGRDPDDHHDDHVGRGPGPGHRGVPGVDVDDDHRLDGGRGHPRQHRRRPRRPARRGPHLPRGGPPDRRAVQGRPGTAERSSSAVRLEA